MAFPHDGKKMKKGEKLRKKGESDNKGKWEWEVAALTQLEGDKQQEGIMGMGEAQDMMMNKGMDLTQTEGSDDGEEYERRDHGPTQDHEEGEDGGQEREADSDEEVSEEMDGEGENNGSFGDGEWSGYLRGGGSSGSSIESG